MIIIVAAMTKDRVIGKDGRLPWSIPEDLRLFKKLTIGQTVVMGRKTYESIGRPLPERNNIIVSTTMQNQLDVDVCADFRHALLKAKTYGTDVFIIGGGQIYRQALPKTEKMYISYVKEDHEGDTRFPAFDEHEWKIVHREDHEEFELVVYERKGEEK